MKICFFFVIKNAFFESFFSFIIELVRGNIILNEKAFYRKAKPNNLFFIYKNYFICNFYK